MNSLILLLIFCDPSLTFSPKDNPIGGYFELRNVKVLDGDTFTGDICLPWEVTLRNKYIRAIGYDAPETSKRRQSVTVTDEEVEKGKEAKLFIEKAISESLSVLVIPSKKDKELYDPYGRTLAWIYLLRDGEVISVAKLMKDNGYIR